MKKSTIWLLVVIMGGTFAALLYLQINYMDAMIQMSNEQFDQAIKRSLYRVSKSLEWDETQKFLNEDVQANYGVPFTVDDNLADTYLDGNLSEGSEILVESGFDTNALYRDTIVPKLAISPKHGSHSIMNTSKSYQDLLEKQYVKQRNLLDEVVFKILSRASLSPIKDRVNMKKLNDYLKQELQNNGLNLPYRFAVVDHMGDVIYKTHQFSEREMRNSYTQILFENDPATRLNYLKVNFPTRENYIFSSIRFMIPSFIFTVIMLVVFLYTIIGVFRQKRLTEMKNDFINNMTHEFKTPISTISLAAQMLNDEHVRKSPTTYQHISTVINDETKRLRFQVEKVLQMSMFDRQKTTLKLSNQDLNELVQNVVSTFKLKVERFGGEIHTQLKADPSMVILDEMHFTNVVFNLLDNAVKYAREDVPLSLTVSTRNEGDKVELIVQDNGIGIKKEDLKRIFEKFYRVHTGNLHNVKGFGLGLAYVMKIVKDHRGTIRAESEYGQGTKFIIMLPIIKKCNYGREIAYIVV